LFAVEARQWRTYPDTASAALRSGYLPGIAIAVAGDTVGPTFLLRLVRLAKPDMRADEPAEEIADGGCPRFLLRWKGF